MSVSVLQLVQAGDLDAVKEAIAAAATVTQQDQWGNSPLHYAANSGSPPMVAVLLNSSADPNCSSTDGLTAAHLAAARGHVTVVKLLVQHGANLMHPDNHGRTVMDIASEQKQSGLLAELEKIKTVSTTSTAASPNPADADAALMRHGRRFSDDQDDSNPEYEVVVTSPADGTDAGSDAAAGSPEAATPSPSPCPASSAEPTEDRPVLERFFCAAQRGNLEQLGAILMADETLDLAVTNEDGDSALHLAASADHMGVVKLLLIHGASPHLPSLQAKQTSLHVAAENGNIDVAALLVTQYGVPLSTLDANGRTALHLAALRGHGDLVQVLLERSGSTALVSQLVSAKDKDGKLAYDLALDQGHDNVARSLGRVSVLQRDVQNRSEPGADQKTYFQYLEYLGFVLRDNSLKQLESVFSSYIDVDTGTVAREPQLLEQQLLSVRLFLVVVGFKRKEAGLEPIPEDDADSVELTDAALQLWCGRREQEEAGPVTDLAADDMFIGTCILAARAIAEAHEAAGVIILGTSHGSDTSIDQICLRVVDRVKNLELSQEDATRMIAELQEVDHYSTQLEKLEADQKEEPKPRKFAGLMTKGVSSLRGIADAGKGMLGLLASPTSPTSSSPQDDAAKPANGASISGAPAWWNNPPPRKKKTASSKKQRKQNASPAVAAKDAADDGDAASSVPIETPEPFSSQEALCQPKFDLTVPTVIAKAPAWTSADLEDAQDDNLDRRPTPSTPTSFQKPSPVPARAHQAHASPPDTPTIEPEPVPVPEPTPTPAIGIEPEEAEQDDPTDLEMAFKESESAGLPEHYSTKFLLASPPAGDTEEMAPEEEEHNSPQKAEEDARNQFLHRQRDDARSSGDTSGAAEMPTAAPSKPKKNNGMNRLFSKVKNGASKSMKTIQAKAKKTIDSVKTGGGSNAGGPKPMKGAPQWWKDAELKKQQTATKPLDGEAGEQPAAAPAATAEIDADAETRQEADAETRQEADAGRLATGTPPPVEPHESSSRLEETPDQDKRADLLQSPAREWDPKSINMVLSCPKTQGYGLILGLKRNQVHVADVSACGVAETAGLLAGDRVVSVEGTELSGESGICFAKELLQGRKGADVNIVVARTLATLKRGLFSPTVLNNLGSHTLTLSPKSGSCGLTLIMTRTLKEVVVTSVVENGAADEAGLQTGDVLKAINGTDLTMCKSLVEIQGLLRAGGDAMAIVVKPDPSKKISNRLTKSLKQLKTKDDPLQGMPQWWKDAERAKSKGSD